MTDSIRWFTLTRLVLVAGYVALVLAGFRFWWQPRVFWTMLLPILPIAIVLMGFPAWRRLCPLAWFGELGRRFNRGSQRRVPAWLERWFFVVTFGLLLSMLVFRLVATNGDGRWLAGLLVALALAAIVTNTYFTGKTWCNFVCPVGMVERIYTEPGSLIARRSNSQCDRCTACKKFCPDIDQENGYWQELMSTGRRIATFAFPGLVLAFYTYYWLRHGTWEAYFDGRWTREPVHADLVLGPGFFFTERVPAVVAATLTLVVFSAASYGLFRLVELVLGRLVADVERKRHYALALAAFTAFVVFYVFAGAPTFRTLPGGTRIVAFVTPVVATLFLAKRWRRRRERYIRERGAAKLLRHWPFDGPPPKEPDEVYAWIKAGEHAREKHLVAYASTVREIIADGLVQGGELRFLEEVRKQLGITAREHEQVVARLSAEDRELFARADQKSLEQRVQLKGYQTALSEALLRKATEREIVELREAFGVSQDDHKASLKRLRGEPGPLRHRALAQVELAATLHGELTLLGRGGLGPEFGGKRFLADLLLQAQDAAVRRALEFLAVVGDKGRIEALHPRIVCDDREARRSAFDSLVSECGGHADLVARLEGPIVERLPETETAADGDDGSFPDRLRELFERHARSTDSYVRAAAVWTATEELGLDAGPIVAGAIDDPNELVRETAVAGARRVLEIAEAEALAAEKNDAAPRREKPAPRSPVAVSDSKKALAELWQAIREESTSSFSSLPTIERMQYLRLVPLFSGLDPEDLHELSRVTREETFEAPGVLCREGDTEVDDLFVIVGGRASVVVTSKDDADAGEGERGERGERELEVLEPGAVIGELSLLDGGPRSATVRPKDGPLQVLRISGWYFRSRLLHRERVTNPLLSSMTRIIRRLLLRAAGAR